MNAIPASASPVVRPDTQPIAEAVNARVVALMRCLLALSALVIAHIEAYSASAGGAIYVLLGYCAYSLTLFIFMHQRALPLPLRGQHWADVAFFVVLVSLTGGTSSPFYHFFFFAILVASFSRGAREGFAVTLVSVALFSSVGLVATPVQPRVELDRAVGRALYLFLLGYMIAYWGGHECALRRRLGLLREISSIANARLGIEHAITQGLRRLADYFEAESALLVLPKPGPHTRLVYRVDRVKQLAAPLPDDIGAGLVKPLLSLPTQLRAFYGGPAWRFAGTRRFAGWEPGEERCAKALGSSCAELADLLDTRSFATAPYQHADGSFGRIYLIAPRRRMDAEVDTGFLAQAADQMANTVNSVLLLEQLTAKAAEEERSKISRDIHDTNLQAYIGLKLGLEALHRSIAADSPAAARVKELLDMATLTIEDLRTYVSRLRESDAAQAAPQLLNLLDEQARRYRDYHGIDVTLKCTAPKQHLNERISTEACRIVSEALSNVLRHTRAKHAYVDVRCEGDALCIEVANDASAERGTAPFVPRSISERTLALGGKVQVRLNREGRDVVRASIPLPAKRAGNAGIRPAA
jgi:signal transduction histidine kinase